MDYRSRSLRLDDEVWAAIQAHEKSANQILRDALGLNDPDAGRVIGKKMEHFGGQVGTVTVNKMPTGLKNGDPVAIQDGKVFKTDLDATAPRVGARVGKASTETVRQAGLRPFKGPLLKPSEKKSK